MNRSSRLILAVSVAFVAAFGVTLSLVKPGETSSPVVALAAAQAQMGTTPWSHESGDPDYDLERLAYVSRALNSVKENYVDQRRVDPKQMIVASLDAVEKAVAEIMVEGDAASGKLRVTVGGAQQDVDISGVKTLWEVDDTLRPVMAFVKKHLVAHEDLREIEFAAVNGMLQSLDPHSILLDPKMFREMRVQTKGEFGGLGFVISMREGNLTVVRVLKNTPAARAGVKPKDVIARIEDQSTVNMDLQDAVDRLRGKPGTRIHLTVSRPAWPEARRLTLQREMIAVETVPHAKLLEGGIGYVKLSTFSATSTRDLVAAVQAQRAEAGGALKGLVLDLRGNPGGLLEQAIAVADLFLREGVIVKTVGEGDRVRMHEVKEASAQREDMASMPLVVIVNNSSASASEIVAGALKNNDRALVIGRQTFGKGSVQVLYDMSEPGKSSDEQSALKLTIAQYLTPGDLSIQEVGVTPDVLLLPGRALKDSVNFFAPPRSMGEADLDHHFVNPGQVVSEAEQAKRAKEREERREKAALELRYLLDEKEDALARALAKDEKDAKREAAALMHAEAGMDLELTPEQEEDEDSEANPDELVEDYQIRFARELLARNPYPTRGKLLDGARQLVTERRQQESSRLEEKLKALGVDWSSGPSDGTPRAVVTFTPPPTQRNLAGETVPWTVTVENQGDGAFRRLRAWSRVEKSPLLDRREFVFGTVKPGEKKSWTVPLRVPPGLDSRHDEIVLTFDEENGKVPPPASTAVDIAETSKPVFAFSTQIVDDAGNGDGLLQRGERISLRVDVKNEGTGRSGDKSYVSLKNLGDEKTFIEKGRVVIGALAPGESKTAVLSLEVKKGGTEDKVPLRVMVADEKFEVWSSERLEVPVLADGKPRVAASGAVRVKKEHVLLRGGAAEDAPVVAWAKRGAVMPAVSRSGAFTRVEWAKDRHAFVATSDVEAASGSRISGEIAQAWQRQPPRIELAPDPAKGAPVTDANVFTLKGSALVPNGVPGAKTKLRDVFVFVNDQKVFFKVVPENGTTTRVDFSTELPLEPGNNTVTVFAREDEEFQSHRTFHVHRRPAAEVAQGRR